VSEVASEPSTQRSSEARGRARHRDTGGEPSRSEQPRRYQPPVSRLWWLRRRSYVLFVLRELSSVFVAWFVVYLLLLVDAVHGGSGSYRRFLEWAGSPWVVVLNIVALAFVVLHAVTWFNLAPRALVIRLQGRRLPSWMVAAGHFAAWAVASAAVAWIVLRGL
jgi:fumarate reductase subunit C